MKTIVSCFIYFFIYQFYCFGDKNPTREIKRYLPADNEIAGWKIIDSPQRYKGDDLFLLIDGGSDIYLEYGFNQVVNCMYINEANSTVKVEIYDMKGPEAAYGIFTNNTGAEGEKISVGNGGVVTNYNLIFWKNNYLVSIIGSDKENLTKAGLLSFAKAIDSKIGPGGKRPLIVDILYNKKEDPLSIKYLRGSLALMNNYQFMSEDIFKVKEGVIGTYSDYVLYAFRYQTYEDAKKWFKNAGEKIKVNLKYSSFKQMPAAFSFVDSNNKLFTCYAYKNYLLIILEKNEFDPAEVFNGLKEKINSGI